MLFTKSHVDAQRAAFCLDRMSSDRLANLANKMEAAAPLATLPVNRPPADWPTRPILRAPRRG